MKNVETETKIIQEFLTAKQNIDIKEISEKINWFSLLTRASSNRVLYLFANNLRRYGEISEKNKRKLDPIISEGNENIEKFKKTFLLIQEILSKEKIPFLVIKTHRETPYVIGDLDILIKPKDYQRTIKLFENELGKLPTNGMNKISKFIKIDLPKILVIDFKKQKKSKTEMNFEKDGFLLVDVHKEIFWYGYQYFDEDILWKNIEIKNKHEVTYYIPSPEVEVVLTLVHILRERRVVNFLDLLYLKEVSKSVNWNLVYEQTKKYEWDLLFLKLIAILNEINKRLYPEEKNSLVNLKTPFNFKIRGELLMPFILPLWFGIETFLVRFEKVKNIPIFELFYYIFGFFRYYITNGKEIPVYNHWFNLRKLYHLSIST